MRRSWTSKARVTPVWTMCTPQIRSATAPARSIKLKVAYISALLGPPSGGAKDAGLRLINILFWVGKACFGENTITARLQTGLLAPELRRLTLVDVLQRCRELRETRHFVDYDDPALHGDNPIFPEPAQNAVHVDKRQPEVIGDFLLRHPQLKPATICYPRLMQSPAQIQQQCGDPLVGMASAERYHPVMQPPLVLGELKHDPDADSMIVRDKLKQALVIDRAHVGIGQALDRVRLTFEQHAFEAHEVTGQEDHHDLPTVILGLAGSRNPAGFQ